LTRWEDEVIHKQLTLLALMSLPVVGIFAFAAGRQQVREPLVCEANTEKDITLKGDASTSYTLECLDAKGEWKLGLVVVAD
jgi:hypothetical protein